MGNEPGGDSSTIVLRREFPSLGAYVAPRTPTERRLTEIWRDALYMDQVGVTDNFQELGGNSLLAVSIVNDIEEAFAVDVPDRLIAHAPTIEQLARQVDDLMSRR